MTGTGRPGTGVAQVSGTGTQVQVHRLQVQDLLGLVVQVQGHRGQVQVYRIQVQVTLVVLLR